MRSAPWAAVACLVVLLGSLAATPVQRPQVHGHAWSPYHLAWELEQPVPESNLWALAARLKLHQRHPIRRVISSHPPNYPIGHSDRFWVLDGYADKFYLERATILCKTAHLYLYVQDSVHVNRGRACRAARFFERHIYPTDRGVFGSQWIPGIDDDPHITLFYGHLYGIAGYFSDEDEYPRTVNPFSNQRQVMFISSDAESVASRAFQSTMAHEFQHMIHWHVHPEDEAWDNEGASMLAQVINGFTADRVDEAYAFDPVQLDSWSTSDNDPNYGAGFLWMDYLYERFGAGFIHAMLADRRYSGLSLAATMLQSREHLSLTQVFGDWVVANYVNVRGLAPVLGYQNTHVRVAPSVILPDGRIHFRKMLHPYQPLYLRLAPFTGTRTLRFFGARTMPLIAAPGHQPFWWSNRCDFCDTSMTRTVNLKHVRHARLTFQAWYDIEDSYDYAYVEVSDDAGVTWHTLPCRVSTNRNPNGENLGNGITGDSGRVHGNAHGWVSVSVNLGPYDGKRIRIRFEYVTDAEYNGQSLALRDIAIGAAGYRDSVGSRAWRLSGFVSVMSNRLPERWSVQVIEGSNKSVSVHMVPLVRGGVSEITVHGSGAAHPICLAIFVQAPKTTLKTPAVLTSVP